MIIDKKVPLVDAPLPPEGKVAYFTDDTGKFTIKDSDGNMTTPVQGKVNDTTGNLYGAEDGSAIRYYTETINARQFGFRPGEGIDNTAAWLAYNTYLTTTPPSQQRAVEFSAGIYYFTKWTIPGWDGSLNANGEPQVPSPRIKGQGRGATRFVPLVSSEPYFIELGEGRINDLVLEGLEIRGLGTSVNADQSGVVLIAKRSAGGDGGINGGGVFRDVRILGFGKRQFVSKGGTHGGKQPQQHLTFENFWTERRAGVHFPAISIYGQHGQVDSIGSNLAVGAGTSIKLGPNVHIASMLGTSASAVASVNSNALTFSNATVHFYVTGQAVRIVPTGAGTLPGTLAVGTTYYAVPQSNYELRLATSVANILSNTLIAIAANGTAGTRVVPYWITNVNTTTGVFTANDNLLMSYGDGVVFVGSNLPAGVTNGADLFARPITNNTFYLYDTHANALAGGTTGRIIPTTTGTYTDYGFYFGASSSNPAIGPINIELGLLSSTEAEVGILVDGAEAGLATYVGVRPYFEQHARAIEVRGSAQVVVHGGELANSGAAIYGTPAQANGSVFTADGTGALITVTNSPRILGTNNRYITKRLGGEFRTGTSDTPIVPSGITTGLISAGTGNQLGNTSTIITNYSTFTMVNCGTTAVNTISSRLMPGSFISIRASAGATSYLDFIAGDNLWLNGRTRVRVKQGQVITFRMSDTGLWVFVSLANSNDEVRVSAQSTTATAARAVAPEEVGGLIICSGTTAYALTIPTDTVLSLTAFNVGDVISLYQAGTGQVSFVADTANGVVLRKAANIPDSLQYNITTVMKIGANEWTYV